MLVRLTVGSADSGVTGFPVDPGVMGWALAASADACSASIFARCSFCSSTLTSSSSVLRSSFEAFLNSPRLLPSERPSSGSLRGPKMIERDHQDDDQLGHADGTKHKACSSRLGSRR